MKKERFNELMSVYLEGRLEEEGCEELYRLLESDERLKTEYLKELKLHAIQNIPYFNSVKDSNYGNLKTRLVLEHGSKRNIAQARNIDKQAARRWPLWVKSAAIAAVVVVSSIASIAVYEKQATMQGELAVIVSESSSDSQTKLTLPDGTVVWLNSSSKLIFNHAFGRNNRVVTLEGEAFFDVFHDHKKQFIVQLDNIAVKVCGTKFNVRGYASDSSIVTTLIEGKVDFENTLNGEKVRLAPDQAASYDRSTGMITHQHKKHSAPSVMWKVGVWAMYSIPLGELCSEMESLYGVTFTFDNEKLRETRITGQLYREDTLDDFLRLLRKTNSINFEREGDHITIK